MTIDRTNAARPNTPLASHGATSVPHQAGPKAAGDRLKLAVDPHAVDSALAEISQAQLPHRGHLLILHSQQDAWAREAAGVVAKAYAALQTVEAGQQDVLAAKPEATVRAARAKVGELAKELAAHDPREVRSDVLSTTTAEESAIIHKGIEVGLPPQRGDLTKAQYDEARAAWGKQKQADITAARAVVAQQQDRENLLRLPSFSVQLNFELDQAEQDLKRKLGPTQWAGLLEDLIDVTGAISDEAQRQAGRPPRR